MEERFYSIDIQKIVSEQDKATAPKDADGLLKDFFAVDFLQRKQENKLLGDFDAEGNYKIDDKKIIEQLHIVPKKFDNKEGDVVYMHTKLETFLLNYKIVFEISTSFCNAYLYLIEIEQGVEEDIKHVTLLDSVLDTYSPKFKEEVYKLWKVYLEEDIYDKNDYLLNLLKSQEEKYQFNKELFEILSQLYMVRMLKVLDSCGELGEKIKAEYKQTIERLGLKDPSVLQDNSRLKQVLDSIIKKHDAFKEIAKTSEGAQVVAGFAQPIKKITAVVKEVANTEMPAKEEKKDAKKGASKPAKKKGKVKAKGKSAPSKGASFSMKKYFGYSYPVVNVASSGGKKKEEKTIEKPKEPPKVVAKPPIEPVKPVKPPKESEVSDSMSQMLGDFFATPTATKNSNPKLDKNPSGKERVL
ncbi:MAG: hypothetical protein E7375_00650 [Clostridiales bacterium]|nr:hypothetical protein [Clostridiales bacterium]